MIERLALVVSCVVICSCADAHDVDAIIPDLRDDDAGSDEGASGAAGDEATSGRGGTGSGGGSGGNASANAGSGGSQGNAGAGSGGSAGGGTGQPNFDDVSSCRPCMGFDGMMAALEPCCTASGACGLDLSPINGLGPTCAQQNAPGTESMSCPAYVFNGNFDLTSCCDNAGFCGVMIRQTAPLGCVDPALLGDLVEPADDNMSGGGAMFGGSGSMFGGGNNNDDEEEEEGGRVRCRGSQVD